MTSKKRIRSKSCGRVQPSSLDDEYHNRIGGMLFPGFNPVPNDKTIDPPSRACFNCWSLEHKRQFCTKPPNYDYCYNCGRKGLQVAECPRCARHFHLLDSSKKNWIYWTFYKMKKYQADNREQTTQLVKDSDGNDKDWDDNCDENDYKSPSPDDNGKSDETTNTLNECKDEDFGCQPVKSYHSLTTVIAESNDLFACMRAMKIRDQFESDKINDVAVNLDDTRMADRDSCDEISIVSSIYDCCTKKDEAHALRSTSEPLQNFLNLLTAIKHLPVQTQNVVILQCISERKNQMVKDEMRSMKKTKSSR